MAFSLFFLDVQGEIRKIGPCRFDFASGRCCCSFFWSGACKRHRCLEYAGERFFGRLGDIVTEGLQDLAEIEAKKILEDNPEMAIFGTGLGGISFYIAQNLGGQQTMILFPNAGLLGLLCDLGVVGIALLLWCVRIGLRPAMDIARTDAPEVRSLSYGYGASCAVSCIWGRSTSFRFRLLACVRVSEQTTSSSVSGFVMKRPSVTLG